MLNRMTIQVYLVTLACVLIGLASGQSYREAPCPRFLVLSEQEGETVSCGFLTVPASHKRPSGETLELAVMTLKARTDTPLPDPILFLQGGPGGAALSTIEMWQNLDWRNTRDIILVDQRGTGYSNPNLKCPELYESPILSLGVSSCRNRLVREGHNLKLFNSRENAADIALLIETLGFESVNLYGVSYGTRLALTMMRDQPEGIRSVVLDSSYPPQVKRLEEFGLNFERALEQVFKSCQANEACHEAFPTLETEFRQKIKDMNALPMYLNFADLELTGSDILALYFQGMYSEAAVPNLPYSMTKLVEDDPTAAILLLSGVVSGEEVDSGSAGFLAFIRVLSEVFKWIWREVQSEGVYLSTECQEDVAFQKEGAVYKAAEALSPMVQTFVEDTTEEQFDLCRAWRQPRAARIESQAVSSDIPTLVLAGSFDPITPPSWGERAAKTLSQSYFFEFSNAAHGVFLSGDCPVAMVEAFLNDPSSSPNASCMNDIELEFYTPKEAP